MKRLKPAQWVIRVFGGIRPTARAIGRSQTAVYLWTKPRPKGCEGFIPEKDHPIIMEVAVRDRLPIRPRDLLVGRVIKHRASK